MQLNARIAAIQAVDKSLELQLRQVDTQRDAVQTEIDAVRKVIGKNIESTFKTFG
jgi:HPt (histidine-containing phosphotransfer) domain-containing protein